MRSDNSSFTGRPMRSCLTASHLQGGPWGPTWQQLFYRVANQTIRVDNSHVTWMLSLIPQVWLKKLPARTWSEWLFLRLNAHGRPRPGFQIGDLRLHHRGGPRGPYVGDACRMTPTIFFFNLACKRNCSGPPLLLGTTCGVLFGEEMSPEKQQIYLKVWLKQATGHWSSCSCMRQRTLFFEWFLTTHWTLSQFSAASNLLFCSARTDLLQLLCLGNHALKSLAHAQYINICVQTKSRPKKGFLKDGNLISRISNYSNQARKSRTFPHFPLLSKLSLNRIVLMTTLQSNNGRKQMKTDAETVELKEEKSLRLCLVCPSPVSTSAARALTHARAHGEKIPLPHENEREREKTWLCKEIVEETRRKKEKSAAPRLLLSQRKKAQKKAFFSSAHLTSVWSYEENLSALSLTKKHSLKGLGCDLLERSMVTEKFQARWHHQSERARVQAHAQVRACVRVRERKFCLNELR